MEPRIEYATTEDDVSIACYALGDGPPLLSLPPMPAHVEQEWRTRALGDIYRSLASVYRLVRFDTRDSGLSQRTNNEFSFDTFALDADAVADHFEIPTLSMFASGPAGMSAIDYAARRPKRVSALVLNEAFSTFAAIADNSRVQALLSLLRSDYELYTETMGSVFWGWSSREPAREFAKLMRESQTEEEARQYAEGFSRADVTDRLPLVKARTLVMHHRDAALVSIEAIRQLAARIPRAELAIVEGDVVAGSLGAAEEALVIDRFLLGEDARPRVLPGGAGPAGMAVILFVDIADSTRLTEELGDAVFRGRSRELDQAIRRAVQQSGGTAVEGRVLGDGVMAIFNAAAPAIECALRCGDVSRDAGLPLHIGLHAGDVISEGADVYGGAVNIAARIAGASRAGEVLVSDVVRSLARTSAGAAFDDRGEPELKGIGEPIRVWAVRGASH
jgi:class 3 adenylate cyclase